MWQLTLDVEIDPLTDGGRDVIASYTEVGAHVLSPHPVNLQRVPSPELDLPVLVVAGPHPDLPPTLPPPDDPGPGHAVRLAAELSRVLVLPRRDVPTGQLHVDVGRDHDAEPGALVDHGVRVDLAHVVTAVLRAHLSAANIITPHLKLSRLT